MTEQQRYNLALDGTGLIELCDCCGEWIMNFRKFAFVCDDGKICCEPCKKMLTPDN